MSLSNSIDWFVQKHIGAINNSLERTNRTTQLMSCLAWYKTIWNRKNALCAMCFHSCTARDVILIIFHGLMLILSRSKNSRAIDEKDSTDTSRYGDFIRAYNSKSARPSISPQWHSYRSLNLATLCVCIYWPSMSRILSFKSLGPARRSHGRLAQRALKAPWWTSYTFTAYSAVLDASHRSSRHQPHAASSKTLSSAQTALRP